jgi:hypothetical protein
MRDTCRFLWDHVQWAQSIVCGEGQVGWPLRFLEASGNRTANSRSHIDAVDRLDRLDHWSIDVPERQTLVGVRNRPATGDICRAGKKRLAVEEAIA